jgi:hypothetical protein
MIKALLTTILFSHASAHFSVEIVMLISLYLEFTFSMPLKIQEKKRNVLLN